MKILFILLLALSMPAVLAYTEEGATYTKAYTQLPNGMYEVQWQSHPEYIYNGGWVPYSYGSHDNYIRFESASLSFDFYTDTCAFKIWEGGWIGNKSPTVSNVAHTLKHALNGTDDWQPYDFVGCTYDVQQHPDGIKIAFIQDYGDAILKTTFDPKYHSGLKWTYDITNVSAENTKFGITITADGTAINIDGEDHISGIWSKGELADKTIKINGILFDPQDYQHDYLWAVKQDDFKTVIDLTFAKGPLTIGDTLVIDPILSTSKSTFGRYFTTNTSGTSCSTTYSSNVTTAGGGPVIRDSDNSDSCAMIYVEFPIGTIPPTATITNSSMQMITSSYTGTAKNCDITKTNLRPVTSTGQNVLNDMYAAVEVLDNNSWCTTAGSKDVDLGTTGDDYIKTKRQTATYVSFYLRYHDMTRDSVSDHFFTAGWSAATLKVAYITDTISPPTGLSCSGIPFGYNCSWTSNSPAITNTFYISSSTNNSTFANATSTGNVTSYDYTGFGVSETKFIRVIASETGVQNSTSSNVVQATTDGYPHAPGTANTTATGSSVIIVRWTPPSSDGGDAISGYRVRFDALAGGGWQTLVANTGNTNTNYNHTGLADGSTRVYQVAATNGVGFGGWSSNMTATSFSAPNGTVSFVTGTVGDVIQFNATVSMTQGSPPPTVTQIEILKDGSSVKTTPESTAIAKGDSALLDPAWYQVTDSSSHQYALRITASNGTASNTWVSTSNATISREYGPSYRTAIDPSEGTVNYTSSRSANQDTLNVKVNRDKDGNTFQIECLMQRLEQAQFQGSNGTWFNATSVGYFNITMSGVSDTHIYASCWNDGELFTTTFYTNSTLLLLGIQIFDATYGEFIGVPVAVFFIALVASMATQRTAPTWIVVVLAMAGIMATLGFFDISDGVWALALLAGLFGLFVGRKFF